MPLLVGSPAGASQNSAEHGGGFLFVAKLELSRSDSQVKETCLASQLLVELALGDGVSLAA